MMPGWNDVSQMVRECEAGHREKHILRADKREDTKGRRQVL